MKTTSHGTSKRTLILHRETLRALADGDLEAVRGGLMARTGTSVKIWCNTDPCPQTDEARCNC